MTWALCLNCGEVKFGAICPCPKCSVASTGDMNLDIAFSDHHVARESLEQLGQVVAAIQRASSDRQLCFWTFIRYVAIHHPSILGVDLKPEVQLKCDELLRQIVIPEFTMRPSGLAELPGQPLKRKSKRWWEFWKPNGTEGDDHPPRI